LGIISYVLSFDCIFTEYSKAKNTIITFDCQSRGVKLEIPIGKDTIPKFFSMLTPPAFLYININQTFLLIKLVL
ncbi:MAG: hypothetical protein CI953_873, partial [Methanohalophilus sp.]